MLVLVFFGAVVALSTYRYCNNFGCSDGFDFYLKLHFLKSSKVNCGLEGKAVGTSDIDGNSKTLFI